MTMHDIFLAFVNNLAAILTALGGLVLTLMQAYTIYQNWKTHREHEKGIAEVKQTIVAAKESVETIIKNGKNGH